MARYGASVFGGPNDPGTGSKGYRGDNLNHKWRSFAELSNNPGQGTHADFSAMGNLPYGTKVRVTNPKTGKSLVLVKRDVGAGGGAVGGHKRGIDLWYKAAQYLGVNGTAAVDVQVLGKGGGRDHAQSLIDQRSSATSPDRKAILRDYLLQRGDPNALLSLAQNLQQADSAPAPSPIRPKAQTSNTIGGHAIKGGVANFEGTKVAAWIKPELEYARAHGWKGKITSGYRTFADQTRIYNSGVRPAAKPGTSNHEGADYPRGAVDVTDPQGLARALPRGSKLKWAGSKDPVHFSHPHGGHF